MSCRQFALLGRHGRVLGQVLLWQRFAVVPLHVLDPAACSTLTLLDRDGRVTRVGINRLVALDAAADLILLQLNPPAAVAASAWRLRAIGRHDHADLPGTAVRVHSILDAPAPAHDHLAVAHSRIRQLVAVERYAYRTASGRSASSEQFRALFLDAPFPPGWSGAPVYREDSSEVIAFIHGNATANGAAAICLLAAADSPVLQLLHATTTLRHGTA